VRVDNDLADLSYRMFEPNMDEYLEEEVERIKRVLEGICKSWQPAQDTSAPQFLTASNPAQLKRNVLAGFRDALLLPVTIVPRTVTFGVNAIVTGGSHGLSMLNPQKWTGSNGRDYESSEIRKPELVENPEIEEKIEIAEKIDISEKSGETPFDTLQMLVSLDTSLELIQADRDSLKRVETFSKYPGKTGHKVREAIEEVFILMLKAAGDRHIAPGFRT
jgi:recyclin-1